MAVVEGRLRGKLKRALLAVCLITERRCRDLPGTLVRIPRRKKPEKITRSTSDDRSQGNGHTLIAGSDCRGCPLTCGGRVRECRSLPYRGYIATGSIPPPKFECLSSIRSSSAFNSATISIGLVGDGDQFHRDFLV